MRSVYKWMVEKDKSLAEHAHLVLNASPASYGFPRHNCCRYPMSAISRPLHFMRRNSQNKLAVFRSKRVIQLVVLLVLVVVAALPYLKQSGYASHPILKNVPSYSELTESIKSSHHDDISKLRIKPIDQVPVSPLEVVPDYDLDVSRNRRASWNFLNKNKKYKHFNELDLQTRCHFYFRTLYNMNSKWSNDHHLYTFDINEEIEGEKLKDMSDKDGVSLVNKESLGLHKRVHDISLALERMRIYDECFIQNDSVDFEGIFTNKKDDLGVNVDKASKQKRSSINFNGGGGADSELRGDRTEYYKNFDQWDLENRMFPFLKYYTHENFTNLMPILTSPNGSRLATGWFPIHNRKTGVAESFERHDYDKSKSFWWNWNAISKKAAKRGIVISLGDGQVDYGIKLLATLRFQGNKLPIQVIHKGDLSEDSVKKLTDVAQAAEFDIPPNSFDNTTDVKQELWFVDVSTTLNPSVINEFDRFKNKWLAVVFNLFDEFVFIDVDAISYVSIEDYFETSEYRDSGTIFFKDRSLGYGSDAKCFAVFSTLMPKALESKYFQSFSMINDDYVFDQCHKYLTPEEKIFKNFFENNHQHQMESGLVAIDKSQHIMPLVISTILNMSKKIGGCGHGDKEFFWLGFMVSGHRYSFYDVEAAAVGKLIEKESEDKLRQEQRSEICNIQLAHMSYDDHLLWLNGGSQNCKFDVAEDDWNNEKFGFTKNYNNVDELKKEYASFLEVEHAVIPTEKGGGWGKIDGRCKGYVWCARYSSYIKEYTYSNRVNIGKLVKFDEEEKKYIDSLNKIWWKASTDSILKR